MIIAVPFADMNPIRVVTLGFVIASHVAVAWSQDLDKGKTEFLSNCAVCHGVDGKGAGPSAAKLKSKPADLTKLAKANHGVFSPEAVYRMIDGPA